MKKTASLVLIAIVIVNTFSFAWLSGVAHAAARDFTDWRQATGKDAGFVGDRYNWNHVASSADGTKLVAIYTDANGAGKASSYVYTSTDSGTTWRPQQTAGYKLWNGVAISPTGATIVASGGGVLSVSEDGGSTWHDRSPNGAYVGGAVRFSADGSRLAVVSSDGAAVSQDNGLTWAVHAGASGLSVAISNDGQKIIVAGGWNDYLYVSQNGGTTWTQASPGNQRWTSVAMSSDGTKMVASAQFGYVYTSQNGGTTWIGGSIWGYWQDVTSSIDGMRLSAVDNSIGGLYTSQDGGSTWQARNPGVYNKWKSVASSADGLKLVAGQAGGSLYTTADAGQNWTERTVAGSRHWTSLASSADGNKLIAIHDGNTARAEPYGAVYISTDSGTTWTQRGPTDLTYVYTVASSADGNTLLVGTYYNGLWRSLDGGLTWEQLPVGDGNNSAWYNMAMSADGTTIIAHDPYGYDGTNYGAVYISHDRGDTWQEIASFSGKFMNDYYAQGAAMSANGQVIAMVDYSDGCVYLSHDSGATWEQATQLGSSGWTSVSLSADGMHLVAVDDWEGYVYTSADSGVTFTQRTVGNYESWRGSTSSADGRIIALAANNRGGGSIYLSTDYGVTWDTIPQAQVRNWTALALSADGSKLAVTDEYGHVFTSTAPPPTLVFNPSSTNPSTYTAPTSTTQSAPQVINNVRPTFSGLAYANSPVTVTIHSDPITCNTISDSNGNWSCTLSSDIPVGTHTLMVTLTNAATGYTETMGPYYIEITDSTTTVSGTGGSTQQKNVSSAEILVNTGQNFLVSLTLGLIVVAISITTLMSVWRGAVRKNQK